MQKQNVNRREHRLREIETTRAAASSIRYSGHETDGSALVEVLPVFGFGETGK